MQRRLLMLLAFLLLVGAWRADRTHAQDTNLLRDGGMEGSYTQRGRADLNIPSDWNIWIAEQPRTEAWMNLEPVAFPHVGPGPNPHSGGRTANLNKGFATFTAALYQQVAVASGAPVVASAYAYLRTCDIPDGASTCASSTDSGAFTRIGLDPDGGTDPLDGDVVWSTHQLPHDNWVQMNVSATATGGTVTLFLYTSQTWPREFNNVYWDDAYLNAGSGDGSAPIIPTPPQEVGFVQPQGQRGDGSIVHIVQAGDTIDSIAVAYGMTRDELLAVNPNLTSTRFIQIGQEIIIQPPLPTPTPSPTTLAAAEATLPALDPSLLTSIAAAAAGESTAEATAETAALTATPSPTASPTETVTLEAPPTEVTPTVEPTSAPTVIAAAPTSPASAILAAPRAPVVSAADGVVFPLDPADETTSICVMMFEDANQNRLQDAGEGLVTGGTIVLIMGGEQMADHITGDLDPTCIDRLPSARYTALAQAPEGYGLTTSGQLQVQTTGGSKITVAFGAAPGYTPPVAPTADFVAGAEAQIEEITPQGVPLRQNLGLIVLGAAAFVLVAGTAATLLLRRR
ncbi:MAG: LysM peptidoglycan-binding domain-containing protein [Chloroflexi bacterium]|nr:LysM peptidoglycan-binding domain-containing protein [Chloroflexota bacterium]